MITLTAYSLTNNKLYFILVSMFIVYIRRNKILDFAEQRVYKLVPYDRIRCLITISKPLLVYPVSYFINRILATVFTSSRKLQYSHWLTTGLSKDMLFSAAMDLSVECRCMILNCLIRINLEGNGHFLYYGRNSALFWRDWGNPQTNLSWGSYSLSRY